MTTRPEIEKGTRKPEADPRREKRDPQTNNLPVENKPSVPSQPGPGQAQFMEPEKAGQDSNDRGGAV